jgi:hypothetical protein
MGRGRPLSNELRTASAFQRIADGVRFPTDADAPLSVLFSDRLKTRARFVVYRCQQEKGKR